MKVHSKPAWAIASRYSSVLASETRDLAAQIDAAREAAYAQAIQDANQMIGALWSDLFNKDLVKAAGADYFDRWRDRIKALPNGESRDG
jgi:hypothetical protein